MLVVLLYIGGGEGEACSWSCHGHWPACPHIPGTGTERYVGFSTAQAVFHKTYSVYQLPKMEGKEASAPNETSQRTAVVSVNGTLREHSCMYYSVVFALGRAFQN